MSCSINLISFNPDLKPYKYLIPADYGNGWVLPVSYVLAVFSRFFIKYVRSNGKFGLCKSSVEKIRNPKFEIENRKSEMIPQISNLKSQLSNYSQSFGKLFTENSALVLFIE